MHSFGIPPIRNPERTQNQGQLPNRLSRSVVLLLLCLRQLDWETKHRPSAEQEGYQRPAGMTYSMQN